MFDRKFHIGNREKLASQLPHAVVFIPAHCALQESADLAYPFRQDSNFWYLTGIKEPDVVLVIDTTSGSSTLLLPQQNDYQKEWDGEQAADGLIEKSGVEHVAPRSELPKILKRAHSEKKQICYLSPPPERVEPYGFYSNPARKLLEQEIRQVETNPRDVRKELASLRQVKQAVEIGAIQKAIDITASTLQDVKSRLAEFKTEKVLENAITAGFYAQNSQGHAYEPIIASGKNASVIHYNHNNDTINDNQLLLLDVGAKVDGYAADISRTWAVGKPSKRHKELYKIVLELQEDAFQMLRPGVIIREYQKKMELKALEVFRANGVEIERYPHGFSHFLGLDVHDAGLYDEPLEEGVVLTVEPGIYVPNESIGIRIEDNVLITKNGIKNLSINVPKML